MDAAKNERQRLLNAVHTEEVTWERTRQTFQNLRDAQTPPRKAPETQLTPPVTPETGTPQRLYYLVLAH